MARKAVMAVCIFVEGDRDSSVTLSRLSPQTHRGGKCEVDERRRSCGEDELRAKLNDYLRRSGIDITPDHEADHLAMAMSLVALLPAYARNLLPSSLTSRPLRRGVPTIDLVVGYSKTNTSPILKLFLSRIDDL